MKRAHAGKNKDGLGHFIYTPEGSSLSIVQELVNLLSEDPSYPISLKLGGELVYLESKRDLQYYTLGMQIAFELCRL